MIQIRYIFKKKLRYFWKAFGDDKKNFRGINNYSDFLMKIVANFYEVIHEESSPR